MVHDRFHPDNGGGGEYVVQRRAEYLAKAGLDVHVICAGDPNIPQPDGFSIERIPRSRKLFLTALPQIIKAARKRDLIHAFPYNAVLPATLAAKITRTPIVVEQLALFGSAWRNSHPGFEGRILQRAEKALLQLPADGRIFLSPFSFDLAKLVSAQTTGDIIAPGIDLDPVLMTAANKQPRVLFAGNFTLRKGIDRLVDIAKAMPDVPFDAVGWGNGFDDLDIPPNLHIIEARGAQYKAILASTSLLLLPSRAETFGIVIYEAMQAGCSIISSIPGDYAGAFFPEWRTTDACKAIAERLDNPQRIEAEGVENREKVSTLTWDASTRDVLDYYRSVCPEIFV